MFHKHGTEGFVSSGLLPRVLVNSSVDVVSMVDEGRNKQAFGNAVGLTTHHTN